METKNAWWIAGIAGVLVVALAVGVAVANSGGGTLEGPTWTLSSIADPDGALGAPLPDVQ